MKPSKINVKNQKQKMEIQKQLKDKLRAIKIEILKEEIQKMQHKIEGK